ncbi:helix-turn-helix transcriptional regulator [Streptomyces sp. H27-H1]|uniref:helix-turn-helix domain-containing protein n=1 Tax=Streptomyces sp. H27-H1 TaxID=2996461 RepID=UPI00226FE918|nr:helix-turn-helix transcriptional regulator [Streptomyces sp. H27-H1]MCY0929120.1 helix-turn-helix transcriptional regulator [Streptomyces sp. H27-H1]
MTALLQHAVCPEGTWDVALARPGPALSPGVRLYRGVRFATGVVRRRLEVPGPWVTLVLGFGPPMRLISPGRVPGAPATELLLASSVSGLQTRPTIGEHGGHLAALEVVLTPYAAHRLLGVDMGALANRHLDLADVAGVRAARLGDALAELPGWPQRFALLDRELARWMEAGPEPAPPLLWAWRRLAESGGLLAVSRLAAETGWSVRQLENRFNEQAGMPPKAVARVMRLNRAMRMLAAGSLSPAEVAIACGFSDQPHLCRDFKVMTGATPREFFAARLTGPGGPAEPPVADRIAGQVTSAPAGSRGGASAYSSKTARRAPREDLVAAGRNPAPGT